jgi:hypothetical protein
LSRNEPGRQSFFKLLKELDDLRETRFLMPYPESSTGQNEFPQKPFQTDEKKQK